MQLNMRLALVLGVAVAAFSGCNSKPKDKKTTTTTAPVTSNTTTSNAGVSRLAPPSTTAATSSQAVAFVVRVAALGADPIEFSGLTMSASGSMDESVDIGEVKLVGDDNTNRAYDAGEPDMAVAAAPAFSVDDGSVTLTLATPITIAAGARLQMLVVVEVTGGSGQTLQLDIAAAADVAVNDANGVLVPGGTYPMPGTPITIGNAMPPAADHLLLTEIVWSSGTTTVNGASFIEVHNPTPNSVDISTYYLTDANQSTISGGYQDLPGLPGNGSDLGLANDLFDFVIRFPAGSTLASGATVTVAMDGAGYAAAYGKDADYCLDGQTGTTQQMDVFQYATRTFAPTPPAAGTSVWHWTGEKIALFTWDGASDLVQDVDIVQVEGIIAAGKTDKTGISIDGPDADTAPSTYQADTPAAQQAEIARAGALITQRMDLLETGEVKTAGNGISGNDETSEPLDQTWVTAATATPGTP